MRASSQPPPRAWPETAAMMGFFTSVVSLDQDLEYGHVSRVPSISTHLYGKLEGSRAW